MIKSRVLWIIAGLSLTACAGSPMRLGSESPAELAAESNYNLCRAAGTRQSTRAIDAEIQRRSVNCGTYEAAIARQDAAARAAAASLAKIGQRTPSTTTNCNAYGNSINCTTY